MWYFSVSVACWLEQVVSKRTVVVISLEEAPVKKEETIYRGHGSTTIQDQPGIALMAMAFSSSISSSFPLAGPNTQSDRLYIKMLDNNFVSALACCVGLSGWGGGRC